MVTTTGFVQRMTWLSNGPTACFWIGTTVTSSELFFIQIRSSDDAADIIFKRTMVALLAQTQLNGRQIAVGHANSSAEVVSLETLDYDVAANQLQLDALEVTQAIQHLSQSVPLIAGKRTVVRLYLSYYATSGITVQGQIAVRQAPSDPITYISSLNTVALDPAEAGDIPPKRNDVARSLNFLLPDTQTAEGPLCIVGANIINATTGIPIVLGGEVRPVVWFHASPPLRVRLLGMRYAQGSPPVTYIPSDRDFDLLVSWLGRAYPVGQVVSSRVLVTASATPPFSCGDMNAQIAAIRAMDMAGGEDSRTHYYGLVSDGGFFMRGCAAGIPSTPAPDTVASGPTGPGSWGWDFDGSYGDWYGGHELGHTFGRLHPGFCGESQDDLNNYPYDNGQLGGSDSSYAGFDVGDPANGLPMVALQGVQWHDVMTYCNFQWLSAYTYQAIRLRLLAENA
ncbi:hypothetical protein [Paraburkholderia terrae]|uniref:hypothetical protein n=1 Tax=Paraburkholderia terrae TaxID=311230 RepID=UPI0020BDF0AB|nr:hypothetical protein [Paraburkholderia terrae]